MGGGLRCDWARSALPKPLKIGHRLRKRLPGRVSHVPVMIPRKVGHILGAPPLTVRLEVKRIFRWLISIGVDAHAVISLVCGGRKVQLRPLCGAGPFAVVACARATLFLEDNETEL